MGCFSLNISDRKLISTQFDQHSLALFFTSNIRMTKMHKHNNDVAQISSDADTTNETFLNDVVAGLSSQPKYLRSKYFYDADGDALFQKIMSTPEYYPTRCEMEIFVRDSERMAEALTKSRDRFRLIELGAGDASKTIHLLSALLRVTNDFIYMPIDISENILSYLRQSLPERLPGLKVETLNGEYLEMLSQARDLPTVILFLGGNIGNMVPASALQMCREIRARLKKGDQLLIGFDLKKDPGLILSAYNDSSGHTRAFNLNLLRRINRELGGNFATEEFDHFPVYDPMTGACKSYLISKRPQTVRIAGHEINFEKNEAIFMEVAQKYEMEEIRVMARESGFTMCESFFDEKRWFVDTLWEAV